MKKGNGDARGGHYYLSERVLESSVVCTLLGSISLFYSLRLWNVENIEERRGVCWEVGTRAIIFFHLRASRVGGVFGMMSQRFGRAGGNRQRHGGGSDGSTESGIHIRFFAPDSEREAFVSCNLIHSLRRVVRGGWRTDGATIRATSPRQAAAPKSNASRFLFQHSLLSTDRKLTT